MTIISYQLELVTPAGSLSLKDNSGCISDDCRTIQIDTSTGGTLTCKVKIKSRKTHDLSETTHESTVIQFIVSEGDF